MMFSVQFYQNIIAQSRGSGELGQMQIVPLSFDSPLLFLYNSNQAYHVSGYALSSPLLEKRKLSQRNLKKINSLIN